jgi:hypothetical protein
MKKQSILLFHLILFLALLSSCKEKDENEPANFLLAKDWKRGLVDKNTSTNPPGRIVYYAVLNCQKEDTFRFGSDGTLTINQGTDKCDNNESVYKTVAYTKNNKDLILDGVKFTLAEESKTQIKYYAPLPPATGYDYMVYLLE